jgi:hypothetical protein
MSVIACFHQFSLSVESPVREDFMLPLLPKVFVLAIVTSASWAQTNPCDPRTTLPATDPAYAEATKLSKALNMHGIRTRCVLLSKEAQLFDGQLGAAFFRTDIGDFEALFLPLTQSWDKLQVIEQHECGGYNRYHFQGSPSYAGTWEGKNSLYFVKQRNQFLHSLDPQVISKVREALQVR